ncbi:DUF2705 family protein [[Clostridium] innocuum]|nr:DUF2705 family protein [[Clostridium] innocuum]
MNNKGEASTLYDGVLFNSGVIFYLANFSLFCVLPLYFFHIFEDSIKERSALYVTRGMCRKTFYRIFEKKIILGVIFYEFLKVLLYLVFGLWFHGKEFLITDFYFLIYMALLNFVIEIGIIHLQMYLEIFYSSRFALIAVLLYYLISVMMGDVLFANEIYGIPFILFLPNAMMHLRLDVITISPVVFLMLGMILAFLIFKLGQIRFRRKDLL